MSKEKEDINIDESLQKISDMIENEQNQELKEKLEIAGGKLIRYHDYLNFIDQVRTVDIGNNVLASSSDPRENLMFPALEDAQKKIKNSEKAEDIVSALDTYEFNRSAFENMLEQNQFMYLSALYTNFHDISKIEDGITDKQKECAKNAMELIAKTPRAQYLEGLSRFSSDNKGLTEENKKMIDVIAKDDFVENLQEFCALRSDLEKAQNPEKKYAILKGISDSAYKMFHSLKKDFSISNALVGHVAGVIKDCILYVGKELIFNPATAFVSEVKNSAIEGADLNYVKEKWDYWKENQKELKHKPNVEKAINNIDLESLPESAKRALKNRLADSLVAKFDKEQVINKINERVNNSINNYNKHRDKNVNELNINLQLLDQDSLNKLVKEVVSNQSLDKLKSKNLNNLFLKKSQDFVKELDINDAQATFVDSHVKNAIFDVLQPTIAQVISGEYSFLDKELSIGMSGVEGVSDVLNGIDNLQNTLKEENKKLEGMKNLGALGSAVDNVKDIRTIDSVLKQTESVKKSINKLQSGPNFAEKSGQVVNLVVANMIPSFAGATVGAGAGSLKGAGESLKSLKDGFLEIKRSSKLALLERKELFSNTKESKREVYKDLIQKRKNAPEVKATNEVLKKTFKNSRKNNGRDQRSR
ncbi:MAG TPA: hypothetical protein QKA08_00620 [Candidatus Megaira endosymbiont of Nemacystus decipiens]|nr:hypothetical protein [Candidatus Megaera endosymbiont of Nemacystus decipiens]